MICRVWKGVSSSDAAKAAEYERFLTGTVVRETRAIAGNRGELVLKRPIDNGTKTEWVYISFWDSIDAVKKFAGDDPSRARMPEYVLSNQLLSAYDTTALHYDITDLSTSFKAKL